MTTYNRYKKLRKAIKYADGTIVYIEPYEEKKGELVSQTSYETLEDCLYDPIYRWYQLELDENVPSTYICVDGNIYYKEVYQISKDNGNTWINVQPEQYRQGDFYKNIGSCIDLPCDSISIYVNINKEKYDEVSNTFQIAYYNNISLDWNALNSGEATPSHNYTQFTTYLVQDNGWINIKMEKATPNIYFRFDYDPRLDTTKISVPCFSEYVKQIILEVSTPINNCSIDLSQIANQPLESLNNFIILYESENNKREGFITVNFQQLKNLTNVKSMAYMCNNAQLKTIDISNWNTLNNKTLYYCFNNCKKLESVNLTNLNTSNVTDMGGMFHGCDNLTNIDISTLDFKNVTDIGGMFGGCDNLINIIGLDKLCSEAKPNNLISVFGGCKNLTEISIEGMDLINMKSNASFSNTSNMFSNCENLKKINLSNCKNANGCDFNEYVFGHDTKLEEINFSNSQFNLCQFNVFEGLESLKTVNVSGCPSKFIDDVEHAIFWCGLDKQVKLIK